MSVSELVKVWIWTIVVFFRGQNFIPVIRIHAHPENISFTDIIILELEKALDYKMGLMPICLTGRVIL